MAVAVAARSVDLPFTMGLRKSSTSLVDPGVGGFGDVGFRGDGQDY